MKTICILLIKLSTLLVFVSACAPAYVPNVVNTPLLTNKGELQVSVHAGTAGFDQQSAFALSDHLGLMLNGSFANRTIDNGSHYHMHNFVELGSGYFTSFEKAGRFEAFGGIGFGNLKSEITGTYWDDNVKANSTRVFVQPAIGVNTQVFDGSLATRLVMVKISQGSKNATSLFVEPVLTAKLGYKYVKTTFQLGLSLPARKESIKFQYQPLIFSIGLQGFLFKNHGE